MEDINAAINFGIAICNDESHGYIMGASLQNSPDTDCSDFVWWCLKHNGFNVPASRWNTTSMIPYLQNYEGFTEYIYSEGFELQHGDILVYDEGGGVNGHTFFYAENVIGYYSEDINEQRLLQRARVEASSSREHSETGDHQKNGTGAFWEVWVHAYYSPSSEHTWHVFRWYGAQPPIPPVPTRRETKFKPWLYSKEIKERVLKI